MLRYNRKSLTVSVDSDVPVLSVDEMKQHLRGANDDDNTIIADYINSATELVSQYLRVSLRTKTLILTADGFGAEDADDQLAALGAGIHTGSYAAITGGAGQFDLPMGPVQSVTSVETFDRANAATTFSSANYTVDGAGARIYLDEGVTWPTSLRDHEAVKITYVAGYGAVNVPTPIVDAIREVVRARYDGCGSALSDAIKYTLSPYKRLDNLGY